MVDLVEAKGWMRSGHISGGRMSMIDSLKKETQDQMKEHDKTKPPFHMPKLPGKKWDESQMKYVKEGSDEKIKLGGKTLVILKPTLKDTEMTDSKKINEFYVDRIRSLRNKINEIRIDEYGIHDRKMSQMDHHEHAEKFVDHNKRSEEMHGLAMSIDNYRNEHKRKMSSQEYKELGSNVKAAKMDANMHLKHAHDHLAHYIKKAPKEELKHLNGFFNKGHIKKYLNRTRIEEMSMEKLGQYVIRASTDMKRLRDQKDSKKLEKRTKGANMALKKMSENLDEVKSHTVGDVVTHEGKKWVIKKKNYNKNGDMLVRSHPSNKDHDHTGYDRNYFVLPKNVVKESLDEVREFKKGNTLMSTMSKKSQNNFNRFEKHDAAGAEHFKKHPKYDDAHCAGFNGWKCPTGKSGYEQQVIDRGYLEGSQRRKKALEKKNESVDEGLISNVKYNVRKFLKPNEQKNKVARLMTMQKQNAQNIPRVNKEETELDELYGKGSLGAIEKHHRSEGSKATKSLTSRSSLRVFRDVFAKATNHSIKADRAKSLMTKEEIELNEWSILRGHLRIGHVHLRGTKFHAKPNGGVVKRFSNYTEAEAHVRNFANSPSNQINKKNSNLRRNI